jgi:AmiR/NasT family two-component response regulator
MEAAHARAAMTLVSPSSGAKPRVGPIPVPIRPQVPSSENKLRVLIAERRASAHSELSRRLDRAGHEVLARVTSGQGALDYAELLRPDVVLIAPTLEDGPGIMAAIALTRELPGVAAVVLTAHPAAVNPAARPNWGAVALVPADAEPTDLDIELRRAVAQAQEAAAIGVVPEQVSGLEARPADFAPVAPSTPQYQTPVPEAESRVARQAQQPLAAPIPTKPTASASAVPRPVVLPAMTVPPGPAEVTKPIVTAPVEAVMTKTETRPVAGSALAQGGRGPLTFTDEDLIAIGPVVVPEVADLRPAAAPSSPVTPSSAAPATVGTTPASPVRLTPAPASPVIPSPAATAPVSVEASAPYDAEMAVIAEAAECLLERTGLSRSDAMRLMEQEAADTGRKLVEVAQSVLGRDGEASGSEMALAS